jgi:hypothetical protein
MKTEFLLLLLSLSLFTNSSAALEKQTDIMNGKIQKNPDSITITFDDGQITLQDFAEFADDRLWQAD